MSNTATTAADIRKGEHIQYQGVAREVMTARTFGGQTDITLAGTTNRYNTISLRFDAAQIVAG